MATPESSSRFRPRNARTHARVTYVTHASETRPWLKRFDPRPVDWDPIKPTGHCPDLHLEKRHFFQPTHEKSDVEALRDWQGEGGAVPSTSLLIPSWSRFG